MPDLQLTREGIMVAGVLLRWYGVLLVAATGAGLVVASRLARRAGIASEHAWRAMVWIALPALAGARLWHVLFPPDSVAALGRTPGWMLAHFFDLNQGAVAVWAGGLGLVGGIAGGMAGLWAYARRHGLPLLPLLDIGAVALLLGQAIGRWGDGANLEVYGSPTTLPWGVLIDDAARRVVPYTDLARYPLEATRFHPVWLYDSLLAAILFGVLLTVWMRRHDRLRPGAVALAYVVLYSAGRFALESLRVNVSTVAGLNVMHIVCGLGIVVGSALLWRLQHRDATMRA
jgi:phosphatidylglycerol:prolipoprotein diacylglycerol transferase